VPSLNDGNFVITGMS